VPPNGLGYLSGQIMAADRQELGAVLLRRENGRLPLPGPVLEGVGVEHCHVELAALVRAHLAHGG
jgi:hypothetical protein